MDLIHLRGFGPNLTDPAGVDDGAPAARRGEPQPAPAEPSRAPGRQAAQEPSLAEVVDGGGGDGGDGGGRRRLGLGRAGWCSLDFSRTFSRVDRALPIYSTCLSIRLMLCLIFFKI